MADAALDILKEAILLEWRGRAFYRKVADQTQNEAVREFFETMVATIGTNCSLISLLGLMI